MSRETAEAPSAPVRVGLLGYGLDRPGGGIVRYTLELLRALRAGHPEIEVVLLRPSSRADAAPAGPRVDLPFVRLLPTMMALGPLELAAVARRHRLQVVHDPTGISPFLVPRRFGSFARLVTIHDAVPFVYPEAHARGTNLLFRRYIPRTLRFVDRVVTVSESSRQDLMRFYRLPAERIVRIAEGVSADFRPVEEDEVERVLRRLQVERPYLLAVGSLEARKNLETLLEVYERLRSSGVRLNLAIVGKKAWKSGGFFRRLDELGLSDEVTLTGYVDDRDLPALYSGAACFVFPSLYEGFGLPPLEAMACGTPVIASNASSIPEVVGDAGLLVDPKDVEGFIASIRQVLEEPVVAAELRQRGLNRARRFSWQRAAAEHAMLYRTLIET